jgi:site-specific DNA-adenine methylase
MIKPSWQHRPKSHWGVEIRERIASQVDSIRHWKVYNEDWQDLEAGNFFTSTWFVDPPYVLAGSSYTFGSRDIEYLKLGRWCQQLPGQVIVCENAGANWLPFKPFCTSKSTHHSGSTTNQEVVWSKP